MSPSDLSWTYSMPSTPVSPTDSGYSSSTEILSPERRCSVSEFNLYESCSRENPVTQDCLQQPTSWDGPSDDRLDETAKPQHTGTSNDTDEVLNSSIHPHLNARSRKKTFRCRPHLNLFDSGSSLRSNNSLSSPDRFVPVRRSTLDSATQSFRANKSPYSLSRDEKLLRHSGASVDAFKYRRRVTSPLPTPTRPLARRGSILTFQRDPSSPTGERQISAGTIWTVGGLAPGGGAISDGRGGLIGSGTNAPLFTTSFSAARPRALGESERHESRLAEALDIDRVQRVLEFREPTVSRSNPSVVGKRRRHDAEAKTTWNGSGWVLEGKEALLDAPNLRDDFYCSVLAYSPTCHTLAVGLGTLLYAWSEMQGVHLLNNGRMNQSWLTSLAFSSTQGCKSILAFGRSDGSLNLMSLYDSLLPRFEVQQPCPIACVTWKPVVTLRPSQNPMTPGVLVKTEELLIGDEHGNIYYYSVEWPHAWEVARDSWSGSMKLIARISIHTQQICGLSFSNDGSMFASGGNDNLCCLFKSNVVLQTQNEGDDSDQVYMGEDSIRRVHSIAGMGHIKEIGPGAEKYRWIHSAAVKAIAFCPWLDGLVATGGGSNDKCIHFYHAGSGACLATISVSAQVTSLIWSNTRREIVATFGYAQPEHPYRIAVFSWPECKQVAAIPWEGEHRALYAIPYPGGPNESHTSREGGRGLSRTAQEGCIVVASSDESVKFHEVWTSSRKATIGASGLFGGSDILEGLEGIDKEGEVIR
ncbi:hypothetical protein B7494_g3459 [Chlorociboria aeruginascens]|nr:hypothetical protein B7494_g3459 [Chlorociboria aeruginascens]